MSVLPSCMCIHLQAQSLEPQAVQSGCAMLEWTALTHYLLPLQAWTWTQLVRLQHASCALLHLPIPAARACSLKAMLGSPSSQMADGRMTTSMEYVLSQTCRLEAGTPGSVGQVMCLG